MDHTDLKLGKNYYLVLVVLDAATNLIWATPQLTKTCKETTRAIRQWMDYHNCKPKRVFGDMAFFEAEFMKFWTFHNVTPIVSGPQTPWPNRAEAANRLISGRDLVQACSWARNTAPMISGFSPIELATGRRPVPLFDPENATPAQLTSDETAAEDLRDQQIKALALKAHIAAKQDMDLRADLGRRVLPTEGPFEPGERVFYWMQDSNLKPSNGKWIPAKVLKQDGPMVLLEDQNRVVKINQSKITKDRDVFHDVPLPKSLSQEKEEKAENSTEEELLKKFQKYEREDPEAKQFVFSQKGGPLWRHVAIRRTYDRQSNLLIADEFVQHLPASELSRALPEWVEKGIRTVLFYHPHSEPSVQNDLLYYPNEKAEEELPFFISETNMDVPA